MDAKISFARLYTTSIPSLPIPEYESIGRTLCGRLLSLIRELITLVYCVFQLLKTEFNESALSL